MSLDADSGEDEDGGLDCTLSDLGQVEMGCTNESAKKNDRQAVRCEVCKVVTY